jgi:peptidyl-prolyl cis-trans isomerase SurA
MRRTGLQVINGNFSVTTTSFMRFRFTCTIALSALCLAPIIAGCNRTHSPDVMAEVNGKKIMRADVERYYRNSLGDSQQEPPAEQANIARLNILRQLVDDEIRMQRAAKLNLTATDEEVDAKLNEIKSPYTQEEFDKRLKTKNLTIEDLRRDLRRQITGDKLDNKEIISKINITDADIANYYNAHKSEFNLIEPQYHLAQIIVTSVPAPQAGNLQNNKATNDAEARKKIEALHNRLESGEDFGNVAMNFSEQPSTASNGGDLGFIPESQLRGEPDVYNSVTKLRAGEITGILPLRDSSDPKKVMGYAIYKLISRDAAGQRELNDPRVQQAIRQLLRDSHAQLLKNAYYEMLRDQAKIEPYFAEEIFRKGAQ